MFEQNNTQSNPFTNAGEQALSSLQAGQPGGDLRRSNSNASTAATAAVNSTPMTIPQNMFTNPAIQPSSVINLCNSTDVVIGPMTQYQGPVNIYQYMDATVEARSMQAGAGITNTKSTASATVKQKLTRNSILLVLLITLVLICSGVIVYIELTRQKASTRPAEIYFGNNYDHDTFPNLGNGHLVVNREQWGATEVARPLTVPLTHPIPYVLITHIGVQSTPCTNIYKCSIKMRSIQDSSIAEKNLNDINANFYVSNEGNIYVGRGWDWANTYAKNSVAITFMGDYGRYMPSQRQLEGVQYLLAHAVANKYIDTNYKLVAQNQTRSTKSPGVNVYKEIKTWPHFYPCNMDGNLKCGIELGMNESSWDSKM